MLDATHKLAVVTGASTGIGLELARIAAKEKYDLIIAANEPEIEGICLAPSLWGGLFWHEPRETKKPRRR